MSDIEKIQNRLLEMAKEICDILEKNKIQYMLAFGTLLGAVRHKGFIPWDDDFDIYLFDETYDKALDVLKKELPNDMFVEYFDTEPKYFHDWAHIKDLNTEVYFSEYPQDNIYEHKGISIDLYRTKKMKFSNVDNWRKEQNLLYLKRRKDNKTLSEQEYNQAVIKIEEQKQYINNNNDREVYAAVGNFLKFFEIDEIFPLKKYCFGDTYFYGPNNADSILIKIYGDYLKLPPLEKRKSHISKILFK